MFPFFLIFTSLSTKMNSPMACEQEARGRGDEPPSALPPACVRVRQAGSAGGGGAGPAVTPMHQHKELGFCFTGFSS